MKRPDLSRDLYSDSPTLTHALHPAHSGPELVNCVPEPGLAQELARRLLTDHVELTRSASASNLGGIASMTDHACGFTIGLARR
jgi:hypothetical protein